jgi:hypothetical protein
MATPSITKTFHFSIILLFYGKPLCHCHLSLNSNQTNSLFRGIQIWPSCIVLLTSFFFLLCDGFNWFRTQIAAGKSDKVISDVFLILSSRYFITTAMKFCVIQVPVYKSIKCNQPQRRSSTGEKTG